MHASPDKLIDAVPGWGQVLSSRQVVDEDARLIEVIFNSVTDSPATMTFTQAGRLAAADPEASWTLRICDREAKVMRTWYFEDGEWQEQDVRHIN